jgi:hypothetical protein
MAVTRKLPLVTIASLIAVPMAMFAFAIFSLQSIPQIIRYIIAPGCALAANPPLDAIARNMGPAASLVIPTPINIIYYDLLIYWLLKRIFRRFQTNSVSSS